MPSLMKSYYYDIEHFHHPRKIPRVPSQSILHSIPFTVLELHINGIISMYFLLPASFAWHTFFFLDSSMLYISE